MLNLPFHGSLSSDHTTTTHAQISVHAVHGLEHQESGALSAGCHGVLRIARTTDVYDAWGDSRVFYSSALLTRGQVTLSAGRQQLWVFRAVAHLVQPVARKG